MKVSLLHKDKSVISLVFTNESDFAEYLNPDRVFLDVLRRSDKPCFDFDPPIPYSGALIHRIPYKDDQLILVNPGQKLTSANFDLLIDFKINGLNVKRVRYDAFHPLHGVRGGLELVRSNWINLPEIF